MGLSTHVLDTAVGRPASGVAIKLSKLHEATWHILGEGRTDADGRCRALLAEQPLEAATYKLEFATADYFATQGVVGLYPFVDIAFKVTDPAQHHHIPLLLTANGYTTYRGS